MMLLAANPQRRQTFYHPPPPPPPPPSSSSTFININLLSQIPPPATPTSFPPIPIPIPIPSPPHSDYSDFTAAHHVYSFGPDQPLFDPLMPSDPSSSWLPNGESTPASTTRQHHHRQSSLSSLGSAGPASPYTANTSNPHVAGEIYHDFNDPHHPPLTPAQTPSQEQFLTPHYASFYHAPHPPLGTMSLDGLLEKRGGGAERMPAPAPGFNGPPARRSRPSVAMHDSPAASASPGDEGRERQGAGETSRVDCWLSGDLPLCEEAAFRETMPKLDRTMTDVYDDELYNPSFQITSAPSPRTASVPATVSPPVHDVFARALHAATSQHLSASNAQLPLARPAREPSPFRHGSPLAPLEDSFAQPSPSFKFGTATHLREQQKAEDDARALRDQLERASPERHPPATISPKEVDLVYHEGEEDARLLLLPPQTTGADEAAARPRGGSMAETRRGSASAYAMTSPATPPPSTFNLVTPSVPGSVRPMPQQYPFVPQPRRRPSTLSCVADDHSKPPVASADTGTYTCTYHGCTRRFETPAQLQRHKREGHRGSAAAMPASEEAGMTSAALRNTQNGPHKCERINPSTGKPCNTIFSRPYDLTRHEDTLHNARKQKVRCHLCAEEKTFSRNDALTRHFRVCHPDHVELTKSRRRNGRD